LYSACHKVGNTVDFQLRAHRDKPAAPALPEEVNRPKPREPKTVTFDQSVSNLSAPDALGPSHPEIVNAE
jgi:putative transposase